MNIIINTVIIISTTQQGFNLTCPACNIITLVGTHDAQESTIKYNTAAEK